MRCFIFPDNGSSQVVNSRKGMDKCIHSLCKTSASLCMVERGTLPHYHQHLFSGLSKFAHPQPRIPDNWPFNGAPQCNTVCAQADCNQSPSFQRDNSYLFSAERIAPPSTPHPHVLGLSAASYYCGSLSSTSSTP